MRIHRVTVTGFGPFRTRQVVDFDAFGDHGVFLITGPTGAGKSSILDAIAYALYDAAPRYGGTGGRQLRSDHCGPEEPTLVELEFSAGGRRYRVLRSPEHTRPKARGEGLTTQAATAELVRQEGDQWVAVAAKLRTVAEELHQIVPLTRDQFLQVVLLAQGQFQRFLVASSDERQQLLRTLFRSERFRAYDQELQDRARERRAAMQQAQTKADSAIAALVDHSGAPAPEAADEAWLSDLVAAHDADVEVAQAAREQADKELQACAEALSEAVAVADRQERLTRARTVAEQLAAERDVIERDRLRWTRAVAAAGVEPAHAATRAAAARLASLDAAQDAAIDRYRAATADEPADDLVAVRDGLADQLAVLRDRLADERQLDQLSERAVSMRRELAAVDELRQDLDGQRRQHAASLAVEPVQTSQQAQGRLAALEEELQRAELRDRTQAELARVEQRELRCSRDRTRAARELDALLERRLAQYAGVLAAELSPGEACSVCGSVDHPAPAAAPGEPVTAEAIDAARARLSEAQRQADAAAAQAAALRERLAGLADARASGVLKPLVAESQREVDAATLVEQERERARQALARVDEELNSATVRRAQVSEAIAGVERRVAELSGVVAHARGSASSVATRIDQLAAHVEAATAVIGARADRAAAADQLADASGTLQRMLAHHGFADEDDFASARVTAAERAQLEHRIEAHDQRRIAVEAVLADPELQQTPAEPVDVQTPRRLAAEAQAMSQEAGRRCGAAESRADASRRLAATVRRSWAGAERLREQFASLDRLARTVHGEPPNVRRMRLESYVLAAELQQIVDAANARLATMSSGRYTLQRSEITATRGTNAGLEVQVHDQYSGRTRSPESLSGGEKFLASLALALGLAEVVTSRAGGIALDTLFIDEGFGSLDAETLELAMQTLDALRENGRTIGVISHVEAMKEQIVAQLAVRASANGCSVIDTVDGLGS